MREWLARKLNPRGQYYTVEEKVQLARSRVRRWVTHGATYFLFGGGAVLVGYLVVAGCDEGQTVRNGCEQGIDLFQSIMPIAASVISFWFAGVVKNNKKNPKKSRDDDVHEEAKQLREGVAVHESKDN